MGRIMVLSFCLSLAIFKQAEALKCYKCSVFSKPDYEDCKVPNGDTKTVECKEGEVCGAIGYNHVRNETYTEYTNTRDCEKANICVRAMYAYGEENLRNCHVCPTDLCNAGPLIPGISGVTTPTISKPEEPNAPNDDPSDKGVGGEASADSDGGVKASGSVQG